MARMRILTASEQEAFDKPPLFDHPLSQGSCRPVFKLFDDLRWAENGNEHGLFQ